MSVQTGLPDHYIQERPLEEFRLKMLSRQKAANAANLALFQLQDLTPEEQVAGAAVLFWVLAKKTGLDPETLHTMAGRIVNEPVEGDTTTNNAVHSLRDFLDIRVMGRDTTFC